ncbi:vitamin B6 photo-protection and homoeostasis-domain-containing protein [Dipodascopsis uninucleata]
MIEERDANSNVQKTYHDAAGGIIEVGATDRVQSSGTLITQAIQLLIRVFLPTGFPESVRSDYLGYQTYDSIQAFASSIAMLFGNRALLTAVGVGDKDATSTSALFLTVCQEITGRMATILFAWKYGSSLEQECKKFRYTADLVFNSALVFDCLSPHFIVSRFMVVILLCFSGILHAVCTVMANGAKAALTQHFTNPEKGSIADVAAKDASQETIISLLGMLAGAIIVPYVEAPLQTWVAISLLISIHLSTNYRAVRAVVMNTLNRHRANIVLSAAIDATFVSGSESIDAVPPGAIPTPASVSRSETILEPDGVLRWGAKAPILGKATFGSFTSVLEILPTGMTIRELLELFDEGHAGYVLWYTSRTETTTAHGVQTIDVRIALTDKIYGEKEAGKSDDLFDAEKGFEYIASAGLESILTRDLRAWTHALMLARASNKFSRGSKSPQDLIALTLSQIHELYGATGRLPNALRQRGWDIGPGRTMIVAGTCPRSRLLDD